MGVTLTIRDLAMAVEQAMGTWRCKLAMVMGKGPLAMQWP